MKLKLSPITEQRIFGTLGAVILGVWGSYLLSNNPLPSFSGSGGILLMLLAAYLQVVIFTKKFRNSIMSAAQPVITMDEQSISQVYPDGEHRCKLEWDAVDNIFVETTDAGPAACDVFFVLRDKECKNIVVVPQDHAIANVLTDRMLKLPGFNFSLWAEAMGCTDNKIFLVWEKAHKE